MGDALNGENLNRTNSHLVINFLTKLSNGGREGGGSMLKCNKTTCVRGMPLCME